MEKTQLIQKLLRFGSYVLVAALASTLTWFLLPGGGKLAQLYAMIDSRYVGQVDKTAITDIAAYAMVAALEDPWSYYIPADQYAAHLENENNEYVGVGITISKRQDETG